MTRRYWKLGALALSCVAIGAGASVIANAGAASSAGTVAAGHHAGRGLRVRMLARRAVQGDVVIATKTGKFVNVTFSRGLVSSVSGQQLTIAEGTKQATYRTVTLTIPTTARVRDSHQVAALSDLKAGQHVMVIQAPQRTWVIVRP
ncbi:MAG: hypothetical protein M3071_10605 [Actinomycetota bacterium]|nr:hypothetical protein [Actinomycetota bacterium]